MSPSSPGTGGTISTADSLLPCRYPWCCPTVPSEQQHLLPHSTLQDTPSITHPVRAGLRPPLPCSWAQHPPNIPTASNQSVSLAQLALQLSHTLLVSQGVKQPAVQSHSTLQHTTSRKMEISEGNPRHLRQNPKEVELRQGKLLFYYRELWMSAKLVEQELHWFPLECRQQQFRHPSPCRESSISHSLPVSTNPLLMKDGSHQTPGFHSEQRFLFRKGFSPLCAPFFRSETRLKCSTSRRCPGQGWLHTHCSEVRRVRGP